MALDAFPAEWARALVIAAHPDDIEYGIAMAVARWTGEGKHVVYSLVTSGEAGIDGMTPDQAGPRREEEEREGAREVGVHEVEFLGHPDGTVVADLALRRDLAAAIRRHRPDVVITGNFRLTFGGPMINHADHRAVGIATADAARDAANRWVFTELIADEGLEPWSARWLAFGGSPEPTHYVDVSGEPFLAGVRSLRAHARYLDALPDGEGQVSMVEQIAQHTGLRVGADRAVAFEVYDL